MITAIVTAAGLSSRMSAGNKLLLPLGSKTALQAVSERILEAGIHDVIVVTGHEKARIEDLLKDIPARLVHNLEYSSGLTGSIQAGVRATDTEGYMICLADMPNIRAETYRMLVTSFIERVTQQEKLICVPRFENRRGNPVLFSKAFREEILRHAEPEGLKNIVRENPDSVLFCDTGDGGILQDMDSLADYEKLKKDHDHERN